MGLESTESYVYLHAGHGGWLRYTADASALVVYMRFVDDGRRLVVIDEYLTRSDGAPLMAHERKDVPRGRIETSANFGKVATKLRALMDVPGPDLRRAAAYYATSFGDAAPDHWVKLMMAAQLPGGRQAPWPRGHAGTPFSPAMVDAKLPVARQGKEYPEAFWKAVAEVYERLVLVTPAPNKVIAKANDVPQTTADRWIRRARELGFLSASQPGKAG